MVQIQDSWWSASLCVKWLGWPTRHEPCHLAHQGLHETSHESEESRDVCTALASWQVLGSRCSTSTLCAMTEGYPCVHSRTISYKLYDVTVRVNVDKTGTSLLTNLRVSRKSVLNGISVSIFLLLLFCDYTMYIYFSVQTSSLVSFNVCFSLGQMSLDFALLNLSM